MNGGGGTKTLTREVSKNGKTYLETKSKSTGKQYGKSGVVLNKMPKGWKVLNAQTDPSGYRMISNGKSLFSKNYKTAYIRTKNNPLSKSPARAFLNKFRGSSGS